ncbi:MAG: hypothetical protein UHW60_09970 [Methanobrevibacter sp.]|nr:hypothetical protein [Methanobrevibacter sp.]
MILKDILDHFAIEAVLPDYLLNQTFNEVFLDGDLTVEEGNYEIVVRTRQNVKHQMFIRPDEEFPVIIMSELPNGLLNGMKFPTTENVGIPINKL